MRPSQITEWCHSIIRSQAGRGGTYIDATMGNGYDTLFLCELAGEKGKVCAFDIQEQAVRNTEALLAENGCSGKARLIQDGHENMDCYLDPETADVICFNFGYLPGGDHQIATKPETSLTAIQKGLEIIKHGGMMSLCLYSGRETGFAEKDAVLACLKELPPREYTVIVNQYYNRGNCPPLPVFVFSN